MKMRIIEVKDIIVRFYVLILLLILMGVFASGCTDKCETTHIYIYYEPVYTTMSDIRSSVGMQEPREIEASGKIYLLGTTLFINEPGKGVHVIDNSDKTNPRPISFINIPGNFDMAAKGTILYVDSYLDMLAFDLSDRNNIQLIKRVEDVFMNYSSFGFGFSESRGVVTDWKAIKNVEQYEADCEGVSPVYFRKGDGLFFFSETRSSTMIPSSTNLVGSEGVGGSMARFTIMSNYLYAVDNSQMYVFDISNQIAPTLDNKVDMGWGIETIFPYKDKLFVGANNGMHIYDNTNPSLPTHISSFMHVTSCDPVVVNDEYAFVTLRSGTECQGFNNQLDVIDIKDLENPTLVKTYPMENPHGLGLDDISHTLFICEGDQGLKVFNTEDVTKIDKNLIKHLKNIHAFDVIPFNNTLFMIGNDGLYQYDYSDPENLKFLSVISVSSSNK